ncbi:MAG: hypothetical protein M1836_001398 [Candelina mexicana]|nr:MAG: hypothetical protein M1836_001398 [Candelina mexicana]
MSSNFTFPPPPPPPPKAACSVHPAYAQSAYSNFGGHNSRGSYISGDTSFRGRGDRPRGFRGNGYGQRTPADPVAGQNGNPGGMPYVRSSGSLGERYGGQQPTLQRQTNGASRYPLPQYPRPVIPNFNGGHRPLDNVPQQPGYSNGYAPQAWAPQQPQSVPNHAQPSIMGPPIRMSFDREHPPDFRPPEHQSGSSINTHYPMTHQLIERSQPGRQISSNVRLPNKHVSPNPFPGSKDNYHQQKRNGGHFKDNSRSRDARPRPNAAPSVPSFGGSLPSVTPLKDGDKKKPKKKKKRTHNVLGLTPRQEEHEESEEEDIDEEAMLAGLVGSNQAQLQFTYKGQTATLGTPSDIAAWIEERKKRFPTKRRVEEKKAELSRRLGIAKNGKKAAVKEKDKHRSQKVDAKQLAVEARSKMEKARRKLEKEQEKLAWAEAAAADAEATKGDVMVKHTNESKKRKRHTDDSGDLAKEEVAVKIQSSDAETFENAIAVNPTMNKKPSSASGELADDIVPASDQVSEDSMSISSTSSTLTDDEETSSSGSSSSDDERPEEAPSKTGLPVRVPPPDRINHNEICRLFAKTGRYNGGTKTRSGSNSNRKGAEDRGNSKRKGLYQRFLESEKEKEDLLVIKAIKHLAENGVLGTSVDGRPSID